MGSNASTFTYDAANQVSSVTTGPNTTTFGYDAQGNRTSATPSSSPPTTYTYDQANRLIGYGHGATSATYAYNGDGLRMLKTVNGLVEGFTWSVERGLPLVLTDGAMTYVYGLRGLPLEQIGPSNVVHYYHQDHLGSTRILTDASGAVTDSNTFDPYGQLVAHSGATANPFTVAGQYTDTESGLVYLRARHLDPATGQFLTRDPASFSTREAYAYAADNPVNRADPTGLDSGADPLWGNPTIIDPSSTPNGDVNTPPSSSNSDVNAPPSSDQSNATADQPQLAADNTPCSEKSFFGSSGSEHVSTWATVGEGLARVGEAGAQFLADHPVIDAASRGAPLVSGAVVTLEEHYGENQLPWRQSFEIGAITTTASTAAGALSFVGCEGMTAFETGGFSTPLCGLVAVGMTAVFSWPAQKISEALIAPDAVQPRESSPCPPSS